MKTIEEKATITVEIDFKRSGMIDKEILRHLEAYIYQLKDTINSDCVQAGVGVMVSSMWVAPPVLGVRR